MILRCITERKIKMDFSKIYSGIYDLPEGNASGEITEGCIVIEGGAFRGVYASGALDALMEEGINMRCTVGVSAGAMNGVNYVSGQIGRSARINLRYRHDSRYVGPQAIKENGGIIGFNFVFGKMDGVEELDMDRFADSARQFYAVVTNLNTGETEYIEKNSGRNIFRAVQASASMPFVSKPVKIDGQPYLDGGCSCKIPYQFAVDKGFEKILVIRTRERTYRRKDRGNKVVYPENLVYAAYPAFASKLISSNRDYNLQCTELEYLEKEGRIMTVSPSRKVTVGRLERDMEKLGALYELGYSDVKANIEKIREYLGR